MFQLILWRTWTVPGIRHVVGRCNLEGTRWRRKGRRARQPSLQRRSYSSCSEPWTELDRQPLLSWASPVKITTIFKVYFKSYWYVRNKESLAMKWTSPITRPLWQTSIWCCYLLGALPRCNIYYLDNVTQEIVGLLVLGFNQLKLVA